PYTTLFRSGRQTQLRSQQQVDLLSLRNEAARRALDRNQRMFGEGLSNKADLEAAQDNVRTSQMELDQAKKELDLSRETLSFDVQDRKSTRLRQSSVTDDLQQRVDELTIRAPF